ncbi:MAG: hydantoinase B/oxoprolinase family protein [Arenicellales bacterium]
MDNSSGKYRLGFDIGGTFTDFVLLDPESNEISVHKCLTTPDDPSVGALKGLQEILSNQGLNFSDVNHLVHGTTLVTNALIERQGARTGLLTTRGFRDILEMGIEQRYDIHDLFLQFPEPMAPRYLRREITERVNRDGDVITPLEIEEVRKEVDWLVEQGVEALAVCFLHSYKNPSHEKEVGTFIQEHYPDLTLSISCEVQPELREFDRTSTTVANAYVRPLMDKYVTRLTKRVAANGFTGNFHLIHSAGGLAAPDIAIANPIRFVESGPAGGGLAAAYFGGKVGNDDLISFDMGGTTAKVCLIQDGKPDIAPMMEGARVHRFKKGSGLPLVAPVIEMIEVGAGGGSIARVDSLGLLKVGPDSAGAKPGPACYGLGGSKPTVTDANLLLGYLNPSHFLGGRMSLDVEASREAMAGIAGNLSLSNVDTAWGIYDIVSENMASAARIHIVEKGRDPRRYAMVAMGGAGPLHAARVAAKLGVSEVIIPPGSGIASAFGFLVTPLSFEFRQSSPGLLDELDLTETNALFIELEDKGRKLLLDAGVSNSDITVSRCAEMRLLGQMHEITIPFPEGSIDSKKLEIVRHDFEKEYTRLYTQLYEGVEIQILNWKVLCNGPSPNAVYDQGDVDSSKQDLPPRSREAYFPEIGEFIETPTFDRYRLAPGKVIDGPAIIEETESTTVVPPGVTVEIDTDLNLRLKLPTTQMTRATNIAERRSLTRSAEELENDPIGLEIMWSRLINITEQCWHTVIRTAFSLIIGEAQDFACEILDAKGQQLAHSPRAMPVFNITLALAVNAMIKKYPIDTLKPGDVLMTNDPWLCAGHLFDIAFATPVFRDGEVVAIMGCVGHVADIGGTKDSLNAREIYEEGIQIPPIKLYNEGRINEDLISLISENVRGSEQVIGDIHALVSANAAGAKLIVEFMDEYEMHDLEILAGVIQNRAEQAMRDAVSKLPNGIFEGEIWGDGVEEPEKYPVKIEIDGDELTVDFEGAPAQKDRGGSNCTFSYTQGHVLYPLKCMLSPEIPSNAGCYRPLHVKAPSGSVFNCDKPVAVNMRTRTGWYLAPNVYRTIAEAAPDRVQAFTGLPGSALFYGYESGGRIYNDHLFQGGGQGGSAHGDGKSGLLFPTSAGNTSVELFETRAPILVLEKSYRQDSAGAGCQRGGLGQIVRARKLHDDNKTSQVGLYPIGVGVSTDGLFGGEAGQGANAKVTNTSTGEITEIGTGALVTLTSDQEIVELNLPGGSGYGDPAERDLGAISLDLRDEYVSAEEAINRYCCDIDNSGTVNIGKSTALRQRKSSRKEVA